ncbi:hypothetical protein BGZ54_003634 [Gamsiella multidivaricata]|nr:hypothetical protein BGZ54_003634 [Gamsiella multidivaricata]
MAAFISQTPIALCSPFSALESRLYPETFADTHFEPVTKEGEQDLSTWCVVDLPRLSEAEQSGSPDEDDQDCDELYIFQSTHNENSETIGVSFITPLHLSLSSDGFTNISKVIVAHSINSASAAAPGHRNNWVVKMNKKRSKPQQGDSLPKSTSATKAYETEKSTDKSEINPPEKRMETSSPDIMNVNHHDEAVYMSMTEHELLKSTKATKIKNIRVATQYSRDLARALGYLTEDMERVDMKTIRARSRKDRTRSRAYKGKLHPTDF